VATSGLSNPVTWVAIILVALAALMLIEAAIALAGSAGGSTRLLGDPARAA
jgi:hypothetical protein